jgi:UDP-N-acetylglucosamine/UDP-N-acetylgalactosamine 4-epimerase
MQFNILVTGGAGFIGCHLVEALLQHENIALVKVLDNYSTGSVNNLEPFLQHPKLQIIEGDIRDIDTCRYAMKNIQLVSHQAALGSVPRSIQDPLTTNAVNITGTLNIFTAAKENNVQKLVYAASSSTYGDHPGLPKEEDKIGNPLSPYAVTKLVNELYAKVYATTYGLQSIGLRYFNVFGPKQNPNGPYAAVIPLFMQAILNMEPPAINGDGLTSRDFTYVANAVHANLQALFANSNANNQVYNIACGERTTLIQLIDYINANAKTNIQPIFNVERKGDVKHSLANISKAQKYLGYLPTVSVLEGLQKTFEWYKNNFQLNK